MSGYKHFAVIGAGNVGAFFIEELLTLKAAGTIESVLVVTRSEAKTSHSEWTAKGATFAVINYDEPSTFEPAFGGVEVIVSALAEPVILKQKGLAVAAKAAGVKLFVPTEFGDPTDKATQSLWLEKRSVHDKLRELDLPYSLFFTGIWPDFIFIDQPLFGWDLPAGKVFIGGVGDSPISFTSRPDFSRYLAHVLTTLPRSELEWKIFRIEGERTSFNSIATRYQAKTGKKLDITHVPIPTLQAKFDSNPLDYVTLCLIAWNRGEGAVGDETHNHLWPEWNPKKVLDVIVD